MLSNISGAVFLFIHNSFKRYIDYTHTWMHQFRVPFSVCKVHTGCRLSERLKNKYGNTTN